MNTLHNASGSKHSRRLDETRFPPPPVRFVMARRWVAGMFAVAALFTTCIRAAETQAEVKNLSINGGVADGKARLVIEALLNGLPGEMEKLLFATALQHSIKITGEKATHTFSATFDILNGEAKELPLTISGEGEIKQVTGAALQDWSVRQETNHTRVLVLRPRKGDKPLTQFIVTITAEQTLKSYTRPLAVLALTPPQTSLFNGYVKVEAVPALDVQAENLSGLVPIELKLLPEALRGSIAPDDAEPLAFRFSGAGYSLPLKISTTDPEDRRVVLRDFKLIGQLKDQTAAFTLTAIARVKNPKGGTLNLMSGGLALTELVANPYYKLRFDQNRFWLTFEKAGEFPLTLKFHATVRQNNGWNAVDFRVASAALQRLALQGLAADTQFRFNGAARPERVAAEFISYLPADGAVQLSWQEAAPEAEGKLFYAAEMLSQISVSPGLMRQAAVLDFKVMQGELSRVTLRLRGAGEVTRVAGDQVLAWNVEPVPNSADRRLTVQFNQPQKDAFTVQVQTQTPLGAFPQQADAMQVRPEGATRFAGYFRIVNDGAVRLEILQASGLSQISPEQFPETGTTKALFREAGGQRFAYRFSGADFALKIQADQILPELAVSQVLVYHLGENELSAESEIELDIREAPLRELVLLVPKGYAVAQLTAKGMSDYFLREPADQANAELRLVFGQPIAGRQVIQLRLERNQALGDATWAVPRIDVAKAKSVRGNVGVSADAGFRLTPARTQGLTEIATAYFPRKLTGLQSAFRISEATWQATMRVERLPQTVQADVFHLFSIGEGIAYGSTVMNYVVSGAPVSAFRVELSEEYFNIEFTGSDIRNWQKTTNGYLVQLHAPVSGGYTLLATYERPFKPQGETLGFTGARPLDAQTEQGHTLVISAYQFQVKPVDVSAGLLPLETGEVPAEYRLFFDAPILAAYRYTSRPFNLKLALSPLAQGDSLNQVVDRASLVTRISKEGQVVTDVSYLVKNRGNPNFRLALPDGVQLWSATVNGAPVVPVSDAKENLIRLPQQADPNAVLRIDLKLASRSADPSRVTLSAPKVNAPQMLAEWKLEPDAGQRLVYRKGSLTPVGGVTDVSGFAGLARMFGQAPMRVLTLLIPALLLLGLAVIVWRWTCADGVFKFTARHVCGTVLGLTSFAIALSMFVGLAELAAQHNSYASRDVTFLAPVQQAGSVLSVEVGNVSDDTSALASVASAWPVALALVAWVFGWAKKQRVFLPLGWTLVTYAALRIPNGAAAFVGVLVAFLVLHVAIPGLRRLWSLPKRPVPPPVPEGGAATAVVSLLAGGLMWLSAATTSSAAENRAESIGLLPKAPPLAESVMQTICVEEQFALATAKVRWMATKGQLLPLLFEPAVVTRVTYPTNALKLVQASAGAKRAQQLLALESGAFDVEVQYQVAVTKRDAESGFTLATQFGLVNELRLTLTGLDVDVFAPQAVSVQRESRGTNTLATLVLSPVNEAWISWKPRSRDLKREKPVFFAELSQIYAPSAGVIEGAHHVAIRPAQGELSELVFNIPAGTTVTDVGGGRGNETPSAQSGKNQNVRTSAAAESAVSLWRFDPDTRKLRVTLSRPQSRPFALVIRSQVATGPLPFEQTVGLVSVDGAAGQIGLLGLATGNEVQLDTVSAEAFSPINLEDFPDTLAPLLQAQIPHLTVRRAFRYSDVKVTASLKASAVEADVRVESQATLSLGEDRTVLAANFTVDITRAGIFRLSFVMPEGFDVESISGAALSHWTELKTDAGRVITLNLRGKTEGRQQFAISLAGPGVKSANAWTVPQLILREAGKQQGTLVVAPEQGMQLQAATLSGLSQLDPQRSGIRQKGVLAFRILQTPWNLALRIEQVDPWTQVTSLQHATVNEAQVKVAANLQYQIENTGLKAFRVFLPTNAENVRFTGELVADFLPVVGAVTNGMQQWEVKLQRRVIGQYLLQATYHTIMAEQARETTLRGVLASDVNLQRGFVTVQASGRLQIRVDAAPTALQPTEWQGIPRALQQNLPAVSANFAYRLVEPAFALTLKLERYEATKLLPARVNKVTFTSAISDDGVMLTQAKLEMLPGDKRLLHFTLPKDAQFWFAFVNQNGVWPWREGDRILIPLEQQSRGGKPIPVEIFYTSRTGAAGGRTLDMELFAPKFDLPLEDITWRVFLSEKWKVGKWTGTLQLQQEKTVSLASALDLQGYLQNEAALQREKTKEAEQMLSLGNSWLQNGDPQQARRAFQSAYGLSQGDQAFNEDARVQLNNLKLQQALVGLNVRQAAVAGETDALAGKLRELRANKDNNYTQQDAKAIIDRRTTEENAAFMRLAQRLVQQQDAAINSPAAIRANIPEQGRLLTFKRAVLVDTWADLHIGLEANAVRAASWGIRVALLVGSFIMLAVFAQLARSFARR